MSIHESATIVAEMPMMGVFNNLIVFDLPAQAAGQPRHDSHRSGDKLVVEQGRHRADLPAASGRQMA
jgi:hypothetical protein